MRLLRLKFCLLWLLMTAGALAQTPFAGRKFILDAGHGGTDSGATGIDGSAYPNEKDFVLDVAQRLKTMLEAGGATVILTRSTDTFISLTARRDQTNAEDPDAFLSIHCNSFSDTSAHGTESFWWSSGNSADQLLANKVQARMLGAFSLTDRTVKQANFTVITSNPPAALAEMMFISNQAEFDLMNTPATRNTAADAFYKAFADFLGIDLNAAVITSQPVSLSLNSGASASFSVAASGTGLTYRWKKNGADLSNGGKISGATSQALTIAGAALSDAGFYTVQVTSGSSVVVSGAAQLAIISAPISAGAGTGLRGTYYDNEDFTALKRARIDPTINFDWAAGSPSSTMQGDAFSVRWTGQVEPRYSQTYTFHVRSDEGVKLTVNGVLLIDKFIDQTASEWSGSIALTAGQKYGIQLDYHENTGDALVELRWSSASQLKEIIPSTQLSRPLPGVAYPSPILTPRVASVVSPGSASFDPVLSSQPIMDFENETPGTTNAAMFRKPEFSGTTAAFTDAALTRESTVVDAFPIGNSSSQSLHVKWSWAAGAVNPWLRLTTFGASTAANPIIDFRKSLRFDVWSEHTLKFALGLRETNSTGALGADGGNVGSIEFVGATSLAGTGPVPTRTLTPDAWTTLDFKIPAEPVQSFIGNGILQSTTGLGVLEHLAITPGSTSTDHDVYLDNFVVVENNTLVYSLVSGPAGATVNTATGAISWSPTLAQSGQAHAFSIQATDAGTPPVSTLISLSLVVAPNSFSRWLAGYPGLVGSSALATADPDHDGLNNLLEYALATDPTIPGQSPQIGLDGPFLTLTFTRPSAAQDLTCQVEWSETLEPGSWSAAGVTEQIINEMNDVRAMKAMVPISANARKFLRLRVGLQ